MVRLTCAGWENQKWEILKIVIFRKIKVTGNLPVLQYLVTHKSCEKVASDLGLDSGFRRVLRFPPIPTTS